MSNPSQNIRQYLRTFNFRPLFIEELGWDTYNTKVPIQLNEQTLTLEGIAEKRGFAVLKCLPIDDEIPDYNTRKRIDRQVTNAIREHLIVFVDNKQTEQVWQWTRREPGMPLRSREFRYHIDQQGEPIVQRLQAIAFSIDDEEGLTIIDSTSRVRAAFNVEHVTRRFYDQFKKEQTVFLKFLSGIPDEEMKQWYMSVILNRLMFIYFIQKKKFLNGDSCYLTIKLDEMKAKGENLYYRDFLLPLFFQGFNCLPSEREEHVTSLLGNVPFLNGGLFLRHEIEKKFGDRISIPDRAFDRLFKFFESYRWHLDERPLRQDNEVNPDVLGYIFERYINQKDMGAYYTREDITEYICKTTIIPCLFDKLLDEFDSADSLKCAWDLLKEFPDRYIYDPIRHGINLPLPEDIQHGLTNSSQRDKWDDFAPSDFGLLSETWRQVIARRQRYGAIRERMVSGDIQEINDFITLNLDIRQIMQDLIESSNDPLLIASIWNGVQQITVLDPTVGSGAFLFTALNILEAIYESCIDQIIRIVEEPSSMDLEGYQQLEKIYRGILKQILPHNKRRYFILKSIMLNNLNGVDIMEEAVEICKLRFFLKLVAQVDSSDLLEPLPDIDFNIRCGNTLFGFVTRDQMKEAIMSTVSGQMKMLSSAESNSIDRIDKMIKEIDELLVSYKSIQIEGGKQSISKEKEKLVIKTDQLKGELDQYLSHQYGINPLDDNEYSNWHSRTMPFHWLTEFNPVLSDGGFDVVIGNPPYISANKIVSRYRPLGLVSEDSTDIYAWVLERASTLVKHGGREGMIVPLSLGFSGSFDTCRRLLFSCYGINWFSSFGRIPSALFSFDVRVRNTIQIAKKTSSARCNFTTRLHRWFQEERESLFSLIEYTKFEPELWSFRIPKVSSLEIVQAFENLARNNSKKLNLNLAPLKTNHSLHYKKTAYNWLSFSPDEPPAFDTSGKKIPQTKLGTIYFHDKESMNKAFLLLNGTIMFIFWCIVGDDFDLTRWMISELPINLNDLNFGNNLEFTRHVESLWKSMQENVAFKLNAGRNVGSFNLALSRHITDETDRLICQELGLQNIWNDVELMYSQIVKTQYD